MKPVLLVVAAGLVTAGVGLWSVPAGLVAAGVLVAVLSWLLEVVPDAED